MKSVAYLSLRHDHLDRRRHDVNVGWGRAARLAVDPQPLGWIGLNANALALPEVNGGLASPLRTTKLFNA